MITLNNQQQTTMDLIRLILLNQMLVNGNAMRQDRINIYDEKWIIPSYDDLFIVIEYRSGKCIGNRNTFVSVGTSQQEFQDVNMLEKIVVGIFSRNREATLYKEQVLMAIMSSYSEYVQNCAAFKICRIGDIEDLSALEASAMLKRYDIELTCYSWYEKIVVPPYLTPPFNIFVEADDAGNKTLKANITQLSQLPT